MSDETYFSDITNPSTSLPYGETAGPLLSATCPPSHYAMKFLLTSACMENYEI